jgi:hypothetical protein
VPVVTVEICSICFHELEDGARVVMISKESATAARSVAHVACHYKQAIQLANE